MQPENEKRHQKQTRKRWISADMLNARGLPGKRVLLAWLPGIGLLLLLVTIAVQFSDLQEIGALVANSNPAWLLVAVMLQVATYFLAARVWALFLARTGYPLSDNILFRLGLAKLFADQTIPTGGVSGTALVSYGLIARGVPLNVSVFTMFFSLYSYLISYLLVSVLAFAILFSGQFLPQSFIYVFSVFFALLSLVLLVVLAVYKIGNLRGMIAEKLLRGRFKHIDWSGFQGHFDLKLFAGAVVLHIGVFLLDAITLWAAFKSFGHAVSMEHVFVSLMVGYIAATIGLIPFGVGTFELSSIATLTMLGTPLESSLAAILLMRAISFWLPMIPGYWCFRNEIGFSGRN